MQMKFHIPDFSQHWALNLNLIDVLKAHPEYFYDGVEIASCFGCFPPALWNGGRTLAGYTSISQVKNIIRMFNERGVPLRYTFTNPTITKADVNDRFCNTLCKSADNGLNEIICNSPELEEYIRATYPSFPLISSTCKELRELDALVAELEKDYKLVVLDYNWNNDFEKLAQIPEQYRSKCEILINPYCVPNCPKRGEHYRVLGECQRKASAVRPTPFGNGYDRSLEEAFKVNCKNTCYNFYMIHKYSTFVPRENIAKYMELGFNNFKIEGRTLNVANVAESYVYYMVKPEWRDIVRLELMTKQCKENPMAVERRHVIRDGE